MTNRARWLILLSLLGVMAACIRSQSNLALLSVSVLLWMLAEWLWFQVRVGVLLPRLSFVRRINGISDATGTLWAGRRSNVELQVLYGPAPAGFPKHLQVWLGTIVVLDVLPEILELAKPASASDSTSERGQSDSGWPSFVNRCLYICLGPSMANADPRSNAEPANKWRIGSNQASRELSYMVSARGVGRATFPGVRITLTDRFGWFAHHRFLRLQQSFRVLPDYFQAGDIQPTVKRHNALPNHGIHRLHRSGVSSELLELREYAVGDPPKSIAWKASARRDKLMTRQYESEVPVRLQFFVDGSLSTRVGGFGLRLLDQSTYVAASLAKAALSVGDPVSGTLVDESLGQRLPWFSGDLGFLKMLKAFADFADRMPPKPQRLTTPMLLAAYDVCHERFPELMDGRYNAVPFSLRTAQRNKHRLVGVLGQFFQLSALDQAECYLDDSRLAHFTQRFLYAAGMPWMSPLLPERVDLDANSARVANLLQQAITRAVSTARDNEVLVVLADAHTCAGYLNRLLPAVKLALAKHHRVAFVCPSPTFSRPHVAAYQTHSGSVRDLLAVAEQARMREVREKLRRDLVRLGVVVTYSGQRTAIRMVLAEMNMARAGRTRIRGARA